MKLFIAEQGILILNVDKSVADLVSCLRAEANDYIPQHFCPEVLQAKVPVSFDGQAKLKIRSCARLRGTSDSPAISEARVRLAKPVRLGLLILLLGVAGFAQQGTKDLSQASLEELTNIQVYSASKHMQYASEAPSSVTVVTADEIQKYGYRTLADILQSVRGFYITYDRDYSYVGVRGFGRPGDWNSRILLLVDGHRINDNVLGHAMLGTEFLVDVDLIERVEIIRGPSSSLYGADAFFAVINVITRKPSQLKGLELSFEPASFGAYKGRASYGGQYRGVDMLLSGTFYDSQGQTLFYPQFKSPATNGVTRNTDDENSQHIQAAISFRGFTLQGLFSARDRGVSTASFGTVFNDPRTRNFDNHQYFDLGYQYSLGEKWELTAQTSYDQARLQAPRALPTGLPDGSTTVDTFSFRGNWWDSEVKLSGTLLEKHKIILGTEITDNLRQDQGDYTPIGNVFAAEPASSRIWALYGQDEFAITHRLTLSAGLRYDHYSNFGGTTNPRLGLIYHLFQPTTLKLLYGTAFRAPQPFEITPGFGPFYEDNLGLKPETIRSVEGVVEQELGQYFRLSGSVFRNSIDNLISLQTDSLNGQLVYRNSDKADAMGVEVELDGHWAGGLQARASYSYTTAHDPLANEILPNSPQHLAKLNLTVPVVQRRLFASLDAQYTSARGTLLENTVSGFPIFNVTLLGHALGKHLDLSTSVYNLLDKKYFDPGRPEDVQDAIQQDGRSFRIKITSRF
jgi:outer membrane receptor for ferrienterochelin and colicins